jgi:hypothetical protein
MRSMDMVMLTLLNAQERTEEEFKALFEAADPRFVFKVRLHRKGISAGGFWRAEC